MPAKSIVQRRAMAIAKHAPGKLYKRNRGLGGITTEGLGHFASTKEKGLPKRAHPLRPLRRRGRLRAAPRPVAGGLTSLRKSYRGDMDRYSHD